MSLCIVNYGGYKTDYKIKTVTTHKQTYIMQRFMQPLSEVERRLTASRIYGFLSYSIPRMEPRNQT